MEPLPPESESLMYFGMKETCHKVGMTYETLKFYCRQGLVPNVQRDENNHRVFDERNIAWLTGLQYLRKCGMSIREMHQYMLYCLEGPSSIPERKRMLDAVSERLEHQEQQIHECIQYINNKQHYYQNVQDGKERYTSNLTAHTNTLQDQA